MNAAAAGAPFTWMGGFDQLRPESPEIARAIPSRAPPLNRESSQTTWTLPVDASTAIEGNGPPVRTGSCVFAKSVTFCTDLTVMGGSGQVAPLSAERSTSILASTSVFVLSLLNTSIAFNNVPSGSTAITLPIV